MANTNTSQQWQTAARNLTEERTELEVQFDELDKLNFGLDLDITRAVDELRLRDAFGALVVPLGSERRSQLDLEITRAVEQQRTNVVKQGLIEAKIQAVDRQIDNAEGLAQQSLRGLPNTNTVPSPATVEPNTAATSVSPIEPIPAPQISPAAPAFTTFDNDGNLIAEITVVAPPATQVRNITTTADINPGPGYIDTFDEFGNPVTLPAELPDDGLAFREGVNPGPGYGVSDDNLAFQSQPVTITTAPPDDPQAGEFEAGQFQIAQQTRLAPGPAPVTVLDPETGLPVETLASVEARQQFRAQDTGISPYGEEDDPREFSADIDTTVTDTEGYIVADGTLNIPPDGQLLRQPTALGGDYSAQFDPETQTWGVYDNDTGEFIQTGLTEQQATLDAEEYSVGDPNFAGNADAAGGDTGLTPEQAQSQAATQAATDEAARQNALLQRLREQATISAQRGQANQGDWRVKLRLAEKAQYLYLDPNIQQGGILWPLLESGGVVFPYTPAITTTYAANYSSQDLTHSNYRGYFYQNSYVDEINIQATFTAQDTFEANYLLAVIHFFRSATKMFYGQDANRGMPPPLVFLQGLGEYQFNLHPCVIRSFNYNLPNDVDYIRARVANINGTNLLARRDRQTATAGASSLSTIRMSNSGLKPGALTPPPAPPTLGTSRPTYVPTKMEATVILLPVQTRQQVSKQFSFKQFANGDLVKGGFW
jgi:hypothetical protein